MPGGLVISVIAALCVAAVATLPFLGGSFIPELKEGHYTVHMAAAPGTSLAESMRIGGEITAALSAIPGVRLVAQRAGRAAEIVDPAGVNTSEFEVGLVPMSGSEQARTLVDIRRTLDRFPGLTTSANTFLTERIDETISGYTAPVIVNVFGNNLDILDAKAQEIAQVLGRIPGAIGVSLQSPPGTPQLVVRLRQDQLTRFGFEPVDVLEAQARAQSQRDLLVNAVIAGIGIVLLLFLALHSTRALLLVLVNLPFALVGGIATVLVTGGNLSLGSLIGFVTLFGITLRNSIMLISHYEHLVNQEGVAWGAEASRRGASERLVPILMTALVTGLGLLPLALYSGEPGNEIEGPMAIVILGGLVTSTVLNLLVLPTLALRFGRFAKKADTMATLVPTG